ncbi:MAG TPA: glycosyltransferase family 4 protein [Arachidicoccus sp.]
MRIAHLIHTLDSNSTSKILTDIACWQSNIADIIIFAVKKNIGSKELFRLNEKVRIVCVSNTSANIGFIRTLKLRFLMKKYKPDIIHCHDFDFMKTVWLRSFRHKARLTLYRDIPSPSYKKYQKVYTISDTIINATGKNEIMHIGVNLDSIVPKENYTRGNVFKIISIGNMHHKKHGQQLLIKAIRLLYNSNIRNIYVDFIGDGEATKYLKELTADYGLEDHIAFRGGNDREYIFRHLKNYDLMVEPSLFDNIGLTLIEAMAAKLPVIVSKTNISNEILHEGEYGFLFSIGNPFDLADIIKKILFTDIATIKFHTQKAYNHIAENYNIKKVAEAYLQSYLPQTEISLNNYAGIASR